MRVLFCEFSKFFDPKDSYLYILLLQPCEDANRLLTHVNNPEESELLFSLL